MEWERFKKSIAESVDTLRRLPYIGDVLKYQFARNLGFDTIKPDVHLVQLAKLYGTDPFTLCRRVSEQTGLPVHVVDTVFWRACEQGQI